MQATLISPQESEGNDAVEGSEGGNKVSYVPRENQGIHKGMKPFGQRNRSFMEMIQSASAKGTQNLGKENSSTGLKIWNRKKALGRRGR